ncbi:MAG: hypothetical protein J1E78_06440 [Muribaculaceae bacterium]|nr:hypothetical protein [Muribaculaceae bacterium]
MFDLKIHNKYLTGFIATVLSATISLTSCTDEMTFGTGPVELGQKVTGTISVPMTLPAVTQVTRDVDFSDKATIKINDYWIGVYDTQTGELLGSKYEAPLKSNNTREELKGANASYQIQDVDIWYYDNHPEVYIVGVVNLKDVKGKKAGTTDDFTDLKTLLENASSWNDFCVISLDVKSMQEANKEDNEPILMGYFTSNASGAHPMVKAWDNNSPSQSNMRIGITYDNNGKIVLANNTGSVKLNRLISEVNVTVKPNEGTRVSSESQTRAPEEQYLPKFPMYPRNEVIIKSLEYKVLNKPKTVYLAEHMTDPYAYNKSASEYPGRSSNSADFDIANDYEDDSDWIKVENGSTFTFQHYENKHWGHLSDKWKDLISGDPSYLSQYSHYIRENLVDGSKDLLSALCLNGNYPSNNRAPAFKVRVNIEVIYPEDDSPWREDSYRNSSEPRMSATVEYTVHEGFTSNYDGTLISSENISSQEEWLAYVESIFSDYQRRRNTQYYYDLTINDITSLLIQAKANEFGGFGDYFDFSEPPTYHNNGINGEANWFQIMKLNGRGTQGLFGPDDGTPGEYSTDEWWLKFSAPTVYSISREAFGIIYNNRKELKYRYLEGKLDASSESGWMKRETNYYGGNWTNEDNNAAGLPAVKGETKYISKGNKDDFEILDKLKFLVVKPGQLEEPGKYTPYPKEFINAALPACYEWIEKEWTIEDLINAEDGLFEPEDFITPTLGSSQNSSPYYFYVYVPWLKADENVPFSRLEDVYRNFYFKVPLTKDDDNCAVFNSVFGFEQVPLDSRQELTASAYLPSFDYKEDHPYSSYSDRYTTSHGLVHWITWNEVINPLNPREHLTAEYYVLKIGDEEFELHNGDYEVDYNGNVHYALSINPLWPKGDNIISIRPVGLKTSDGEYSNFKVSTAATGTLFIQDIPRWDFSSTDPRVNVFATALGYNNSDYYYYGTDERYGLTIRGGSTSKGLYPRNEGDNKDNGIYIQTRGAGDLSNRNFKLSVYGPGKLKVKASNTGTTLPDPIRQLVVYYWDGVNEGNIKVNVTAPSNDPEEYELPLPLNVDRPCDLTLYTDGNLRIFTIQWMPD